VDDDGTVHFSDQPVPGAVPVEPEPLSEIPLDVPPQPAAGEAGGAPAQDRAAAIDYRISIVNLRDDDVVWNDARELELQLAVAPRLAVERGHRVEVFVDGVRRGPARRDTRLVLSDIDRGTHSVKARIVDADGRVLAETERLTIHHRQHSVATPG
jgi:hypothetical protein